MSLSGISARGFALIDIMRCPCGNSNSCVYGCAVGGSSLPAQMHNKGGLIMVNKPGRPKSENPRLRSLWVRLTIDEVNKISVAAVAKKMTVSEYLRDCALKGVK